jgi:hypothetical protein
MKTTSSGRRHQYIENWISWQPLIGYSSIFKLKFREPYQYKKLKLKHMLNGNLKIFEVEYLRNNWLDLLRIWNLSWGDHTKTNKSWNEDNLSICDLGEESEGNSSVALLIPACLPIYLPVKLYSIQIITATLVTQMCIKTWIIFAVDITYLLLLLNTAFKSF